MANQMQDDQLEHSYSSYVMIRDVTPKTCRRRWIIGRRGERGSGISVLATRHNDDDDEWCRSQNVFKSSSDLQFPQAFFRHLDSLPTATDITVTIMFYDFSLDPDICLFFAFFFFCFVFPNSNDKSKFFSVRYFHGYLSLQGLVFLLLFRFSSFS